MATTGKTPRRTPVRRILVGIRDVFDPPQRALAKARSLALGTGATLELFHAVAGFRDGLHARPLMEQIAASRREVLDGLAQDLRGTGIRVETFACWDYPAHEAILRRAATIRCDLIIVQSFRTEGGKGWFVAHTDWELMRLCPTPLLIAKSQSALEQPQVLVALDPMHRRDKPASLDRRLLASASLLARALRGTLHAAHVIEPVAGGAQPDETTVVARFRRSAATGRVPPAQRHVLHGTPATALAEYVRDHSIDLLVLGAVSRSALKSLFLGHTAQDLIDQVGCDLLIVSGRQSRL